MRKYLSIFIVLSLLYSAFPAGAAEPIRILMAYDDTPLPPLYFGKGPSVPAEPGIAVEMLQLLDQQLPEIHIDFRRAPWKRCQVELGKGLVDMIMEPGMDGLETFERIRREKPAQKVILVSGFSDTQRVMEAGKKGLKRYIRKPYLIET